MAFSRALAPAPRPEPGAGRVSPYLAGESIILAHNMHIDILGAESLGVRGLCCVVEAKGRKIVIDPGLALGYQREGLLPHPAQVAVGERIRLG